jgi:hypothetical protein
MKTKDGCTFYSTIIWGGKHTSTAACPTPLGPYVFVYDCQPYRTSLEGDWPSVGNFEMPSACNATRQT